MYLCTCMLCVLKTDLVLEEEASKGPDSSKDKVELVDLSDCVGRCVGGREEHLQQVAQRLDHANFLDGRDLLEAVDTRALQQDRDIAVKQHSEVGLL